MFHDNHWIICSWHRWWKCEKNLKWSLWWGLKNENRFKDDGILMFIIMTKFVPFSRMTVLLRILVLPQRSSIMPSLITNLTSPSFTPSTRNEYSRGSFSFWRRLVITALVDASKIQLVRPEMTSVSLNEHWRGDWMISVDWQRIITWGDVTSINHASVNTLP